MTEPTPPTYEVERMSWSERMADIDAQIIHDPADAGPDVEALVKRATERYRATFGS